MDNFLNPCFPRKAVATNRIDLYVKLLLPIHKVSRDGHAGSRRAFSNRGMQVSSKFKSLMFNATSRESDGSESASARAPPMLKVLSLRSIFRSMVHSLIERQISVPPLSPHRVVDS